MGLNSWRGEREREREREREGERGSEGERERERERGREGGREGVGEGWGEKRLEQLSFPMCTCVIPDRVLLNLSAGQVCTSKQSKINIHVTSNSNQKMRVQLTVENHQPPLPLLEKVHHLRMRERESEGGREREKEREREKMNKSVHACSNEGLTAAGSPPVSLLPSSGCRRPCCTY